MSTQWTAEDNLHAFGAAACTHQGEVAELQEKLAESERLRLYNLNYATTLLKDNADWQKANRDLRDQVERMKEEASGIADWLDVQPNDMDGGVSALQCVAQLRALATPATHSPKESE